MDKIFLGGLTLKFRLSIVLERKNAYNYVDSKRN